ncbi:OB-fold nucleic acid binding domain-containing protein [Aestuariimicrobium kwangyangense]|uniref:OB-fold nucleic acid binding domain-containing protein n=1 Tax=Aestuariimicrobium kwangyangense TaxID=396389 RepID=UPI0003B4AEEE|nr:OB-fold nucleic acid binding domain-containing protein [Aestuariimicrobium kwangyangense]
MGERRGGFRQAMRRLFQSDAEAADQVLAQEAKRSGCTQVTDCHVRDRVNLQGMVNCLTIEPRGDRRWLEAELTDGTGKVTLVWMGRDHIPGIESGRRLRVQGRLANDHGRKVIFNPEYRIVG